MTTDEVEQLRLGPDDGPERAERTPDARLARIHLRGGMLALARAELEQMAGAGTLDVEALADLAEARWRSGDLSGAAVAAQAHIDAGGGEPIPFLICAEALDAAGHLIDARALAARVLERVGGQVDRLFAGESGSAAWSSAGSTPTPLPNGTVPWGGLVGGREVHDPDPDLWAAASAPEAQAERAEGDPADAADREVPTDDRSAQPARPGSLTELLDAGRVAGHELGSVEKSIEDGLLEGVAERLALLLRHDRGLAPVILSQADSALAVTDIDETTMAALHLVRGDAYRMLGREVEAMSAYHRSMRALTARATGKEST